MAKTSYAIALGSNRRHGRFGAPADVVRTAADRLGYTLLSTIRLTPALGPAGRSFANAVLIHESASRPPDLLDELKTIEREFGRRGGRRWGPRVIDLDILLWSGGAYAARGLIVPHPEFRARTFVLEPLAEIAQEWRDPISGRTVRQLLALRRSRRPIDQALPRS